MWSKSTNRSKLHFLFRSVTLSRRNESCLKSPIRYRGAETLPVGGELINAYAFDFVRRSCFRCRRWLTGPLPAHEWPRTPNGKAFEPSATGHKRPYYIASSTLRNILVQVLYQAGMLFVRVASPESML